jgi:hypothetical protein
LPASPRFIELLNISFSFYLHLIFQLDLNPAMPYTSQ